jgi:aspartate 1-decarboxylase
MYVSILRAKLHQARVTSADLNYVGSISIDTELLEESGMLPYEKVLIADIENAQRFETYIIPAPAGSRQIQLNGAVARLVSLGDRLIIMAFGHMAYPPPANFSPRVLVLDENNAITQRIGEKYTGG